MKTLLDNSNFNIRLKKNPSKEERALELFQNGNSRPEVEDILLEEYKHFGAIELREIIIDAELIHYTNTNQL